MLVADTYPPRVEVVYATEADLRAQELREEVSQAEKSRRQVRESGLGMFSAHFSFLEMAVPGGGGDPPTQEGNRAGATAFVCVPVCNDDVAAGSDNLLTSLL